MFPVFIFCGAKTQMTFPVPTYPDYFLEKLLQPSPYHRLSKYIYFIKITGAAFSAKTCPAALKSILSFNFLPVKLYWNEEFLLPKGQTTGLNTEDPRLTW